MKASTPTTDATGPGAAPSDTRRRAIHALAGVAGLATAQRAGAQATPRTAGGTPGTLNTIDTIVADMRLRNDLKLRGYEDKTVGWYVGPGYTYLGNDPRMTNSPKWFKEAFPQHINGRYMRALLPWLVIFDGVGHASKNTRVQMRNMRAYIRSRATGQWRSLGVSPGVSGYDTPKATLLSGNVPENKRTLGDGSVEVKPPSDPKLTWHGWWNLGRVAIDPADIEAVFVTVQARLTKDDPAGPDDRSTARLVLQVGADYYYDAKWQWTVGAPAVAISRSKRITPEWQAFNMMTFSDVGEQEPGGGITEAAFRASPPPLE